MRSHFLLSRFLSVRPPADATVVGEKAGATVPSVAAAGPACRVLPAFLTSDSDRTTVRSSGDACNLDSARPPLFFTNLILFPPVRYKQRE
jgi:hypothetical protein